MNDPALSDGEAFGFGEYVRDGVVRYLTNMAGDDEEYTNMLAIFSDMLASQAQTLDQILNERKQADPMRAGALAWVGSPFDPKLELQCRIAAFLADVFHRACLTGHPHRLQ